MSNGGFVLCLLTVDLASIGQDCLESFPEDGVEWLVKMVSWIYKGNRVSNNVFHPFNRVSSVPSCIQEVRVYHRN